MGLADIMFQHPASFQMDKSNPARIVRHEIDLQK